MNSNDPIVKILAEIAEICEDVSLSGALQGGRETLVRRYNSALRKLEESGRVEAGLFESLTDEATVDVVGVEARLLAASVAGSKQSDRDEVPELEAIVALAPFARGEDVAKMLHRAIDSGRPIPTHMLVGLAPFLRSEDLSLLMERAINRPVPVAAPTTSLQRAATDDESSVRNRSLSPEERLAAAERLLRLHSDHLD